MEEIITYKGYIITIEPDTESECPREWDNLGTLLTAHKNYKIGEVDLKEKYPEAENWNDIEKFIIRDYKPVVILPVYMYDHSGLRFKIGDFFGLLPQGHAEFDSGKIGYIIAERERVKKTYNVKRITKKLKKEIVEILESGIETLDQWSCGDVWGYRIEETGDSCWGFYGYDYALKEAKEVIDFVVEEVRKEKQNRLKALIKNNISLIYR